MRAVFDTNVVLSALVFGRTLAWLREAWAEREVVPLVCRPTVDELPRVLSYPKFRRTSVDPYALLEDYLPFTKIVHLPDPLPNLPITCRDRDDVVFLHLALAARADALISGDRDLTVLRGALGSVQVISPAELRLVVEQRRALRPQ